MKHFSVSLLMMVGSMVFVQSVHAQKLNKKLSAYITENVVDFNHVKPEHEEGLREIGDYLLTKLEAKEPLKATVICTHNSRRSHMGQLWLLAAANYYGIENMAAFSGGTEASAFNPRAVKAMEEAGFSITKVNGENNPTYSVNMGTGISNVIVFSKKYDHEMNPKDSFVAIMVCSEADQSCPVVPGAEERVAIPFLDPKNYDGTPAERDEYRKTTQLIAQEMFYIMRYVKETHDARAGR